MSLSKLSPESVNSLIYPLKVFRIPVGSSFLSASPLNERLRIRIRVRPMLASICLLAAVAGGAGGLAGIVIERLYPSSPLCIFVPVFFLCPNSCIWLSSIIDKHTYSAIGCVMTLEDLLRLQPRVLFPALSHAPARGDDPAHPQSLWHDDPCPRRRSCGLILNAIGWREQQP